MSNRRNPYGSYEAAVIGCMRHMSLAMKKKLWLAAMDLEEADDAGREDVRIEIVTAPRAARRIEEAA